MWCKFCGQDVPGIAGPEGGQFSCARCTKVIADSTVENREEDDLQIDLSVKNSQTPDATPANNSYLKPSSSDLLEITMPISDEDWQYEQDLRYLRRVSKHTDDSAGQMNTSSGIDTGHSQTSIAAPHWQAHLNSSNSPTRFSESDEVDKPIESFTSKLAWAILLLGVMGMVCGGTLMVWSIVTHRPALWDLGLPIGIASQAGLLIGLILQIERIWRKSQKASNKIKTVDQEISELKETTTLLSTNNSGPSNAFYSHLSQGASSELLLADLKGQMDMLTRKISK